MKAVIINIGSEVVKGVVLNTHNRYLSLFLESFGINTLFHFSVLDQADDIQSLLSFASKKAELIILTGGLGPTQDDLTKEALSSFLNEKLIFDTHENQKLKSLFQLRGVEYSKNNEKQAYYLKDTLFLENPVGSVRGHYIKRKDKIFILLPGPPQELEPMVTHSLNQIFLKDVLKDNFRFIKEYSFVGIRESILEETINHLIIKNESPLLQIGTYAFIGYVSVRILCYDKNLEDQANLLCDEIIHVLHPFLLSEKGESIEAVVLKKLNEKNIKLFLAESCTGGLLASRLVSEDGASLSLQSSCVTYSNQSKMDLLDVPQKTLESFGAVSEETAIAMLKGLKKQYNDFENSVPLFVAITGALKSSYNGNKDKEGKIFIASCYGDNMDDIQIKKLDLSTYTDRNHMKFIVSQRALEKIYFYCR